MESDTEKEWFTLWFNSPYYHILYNQRNGVEAQRFLRNLKTELQIPPGSRILDVACGEGRFSRLLALDGHHVVGIDIASENIDIANSSKGTNSSFFQHDMRYPFPFHEESFDYAFNFFTSFGYFESWVEHQNTLENISLVLRRGGECIIDFLNVKKLENTIKPIETKVIDNVTFKLSRSLDDGEVKKTIQVLPEDKSSLTFEERVKAFTLDDFKSLFSSVPLEISAVYGDYRLNPFDPNNSDRLIIRAVKK